ncbi:hypothetical protein [Streptomyces sp. NPDC058674]|uniref:hypothetical protein n=1 Tax=Streptomyces sp. NPDC058674 TaxID=3346592 RepID=UPI003667DED8
MNPHRIRIEEHSPTGGARPESPPAPQLHHRLVLVDDIHQDAVSDAFGGQHLAPAAVAGKRAVRLRSEPR